MLRRTTCLLGVVVIVLSARGNPALKTTKEDLIKAELAKLNGTWKIVSIQLDGEELTLGAQMSSVSFKDFSYSCSNGTKGKILMIDPTSTPKTIEYLDDGGDENDDVQRAIYKLEGDTFMESKTFRNKPRP